MLVVCSDASVKDHHGTGIGWHIQTQADDNPHLLETVETGHDFLSGRYTSMEAELLALSRAVKEAIRLGETDRLQLWTDCDPLVDKVRAREPLADGKYIDSLYRLLDKVDEWSIEWVSREENSFADSEAVVARDRQS